MARLVPLLALALAVMTLAPLGSAFVGPVALPLFDDEVTPAPLPKDASPSLDGGPGVAFACATAANPEPLGFGVTTPGTALSGVDCFYRLSVATFDPTKRLRVNLTSNGDHDVFLKLAPGNVSVSPYDCSETGTSPTFSQCVAYPIPAGDWNLRVKRFGGQDYNVTVFYEDVPPYCGLGNVLTDLADGQTVTTNLLADGLAGCVFSFAASAANGNLAKLNLTGLTANYDLYVRAGSVPTNSTFDCRPLLSGTTLETCNNDLVQDTTYYAVVRRGSSSSAGGNFNLTAQVRNTCNLGPGLHALPLNGQVTTGLSAETDARCYFSTPMLGSQGDVSRFVLNLTTTNYDLYVRAGAVPTALVFDCRPFSSGTTNETCDRPHTGDATYYLQVRRPGGAAGSGDFKLSHVAINTCSLGTGTTVLADGVATVGNLASVTGAKCLFQFDPHPLAASARIALTPPATGGDFDLYVRRGAVPTTTLYDCRSFLSGNVSEVCDLGNDGSTLYVLVNRFSGAGDFTLLARSLSTCTLGPGNHVLESDVARTGGLTSEEGAACFFRYVPDPTVGDLARFDLTPPAGSDFDLYLKKGSAPSTSVFDCRANLTGDAAERCSVEITDATPLFGMVRRASGSGDFSVVATSLASCSLGLGTHPLQGASLVDAAGAKCLFQWTPDPAAGDGARFVLTPPAGANFDVYVKKGAAPTTSSFDCRPLLGVGLAETCELEVADGTAYYALVRRATGGGAFDLGATMFNTCGLGVGVHDLVDGFVEATTLSGHSWAKCQFRLPGDAAADFVRFSLVPPGSGLDPDLYVKKGTVPTTTSFDCRPFLGGNRTEECNFLAEGADTYFAMVKRFSGGGTFSLTGTNVILPTLQPGVPLFGNADPGRFQYFKVVLPADASHLTVAVAGDPTARACGQGLCSPVPAVATPTLCAEADEACLAYTEVRNVACTHAAAACGALHTASDADLYVQYRTALPTTSLATCKSATPGSVESCTFSTLLNQTVGNPAGAPAEVRPFPAGVGGKYFVGVHGKAGPARYVVTADWVVSPVPLPSPPAAPALPPMPTLPPLPSP